MERIDLRMFELTMFQLRRLRPDITLCFNLSEQVLWSKDSVDQMLAMARSVGLESERIVFELTESIVELLTERSLNATLERIRDAGCALVIDDFGVEHSSIARLASLPVSRIKLDRGLVESISRDARQRVVIRATIDMAHALGLKVVAEGVETEEQLQCLIDMGCDFAQGYLFARAARLTAFPELLVA
jgi:EAL domain-containing protein (putative c-di-GMP-specific phosphodiesterase class I)